MTAVSQPRCECELSGPFCCGVPGVLAWMKDGRVAPGARVERCDECQRFLSDEAARAKLVELGLADSPNGRGEQTFTVQCMAIVRVTVSGIAAANHREAAELARDRFDFDRERVSANFTGDFAAFVVAIDAGSGTRDSRWFTGRLTEPT